MMDTDETVSVITMDPDTIPTISTILVPLDGSAAAEAALRPAYAMAERAGAGVRVLRTRKEGTDGSDDLDAALRAAVRRFSDSAPTSTTVVEGQPARQILEAAAEPGTVICMASHGRTGLSRLVLGSVAEEVVRVSPAPVVLVGPQASSVPLRSERAHLVVCTDGSDAARVVFPTVVSLVHAFDMTCDVVHATPPDEDVSLDLLPAPVPVRTRAQQASEECAEELRAAGVEAEAHLLFGEPAGVVTSHARARHASMIAVATHGRTGLARAALGSTTTDIVRQSPCPVLVVPSRGG